MMHLVPIPSKKAQLHAGTFAMPQYIVAELGGFEDWCLSAFRQRAGLTEDGGDAWLILTKDTDLPPEGYILEIEESGIFIKASGEQGVIWALTTAAGLLEEGKLPCCVIEDAPRYGHRGLSLDCARHFFPVRTVKNVIEEISLAKMNVLHWHLSDDQGWRVESRKFPKLQETSGAYYTREEIRDIVEFARIRGVEVIPEIDMPGHTSAVLAAFPEHSCSGKEVTLATAGGIYPVILCPGKEATFAFVEELLEDIIPLFPGKRFHIGGDEAPRWEWKKCPHCQKRMEELGTTDIENLQGYFTARVCEVLKKHGKQPICWNEVVRSTNHPKDIQIQYWTLQHRQSAEKFIRGGGKWIYSDMFEVYLDYPYSMSSMEKIYRTEPHLGKISFAEDPNLLGMEACLWAEHIAEPEKLERMLFPRVYALAETAWSGKTDYADFRQRLEAFISTPLHQGIRYTQKEWWDPKGKARRQEAIGYFANMRSAIPEEVREQTVESAAPGMEFAQSFMTKFFKFTDLPFLLKALLEK